jgi:tungstate transport system ATP-binding protein
MALMELKKISQVYGKKKVLENVNLKLEKRQLIAVLGPTGSGKTTLLRIMALLDPPWEGEVIFMGKSVNTKSLWARRLIGFVSHKPFMFKGNIYHNLSLPLRWRGFKKGEIKKKVSWVLELLDLKDYEQKEATELSAGEAQKIAIGRAIISDPELLILDEPTANLDPYSTKKVEELIRGLVKEKGISVIFSTHSFDQAKRLADYFVVLGKGKAFPFTSFEEAHELFLGVLK